MRFRDNIIVDGFAVGTSSFSAGNTFDTMSATISVGSNPFYLALDSQNDTLYVCNAGSNSISVIDCSTNIVTDTISIPTPYSPTYVESINTLYVPMNGPPYGL